MVEYNYILLEKFVREAEQATQKAVELRFSNGGRREIYASLDRRAGLYKVEFVNDFGREQMDPESMSVVENLENESFESLDDLKSEVKEFYDYRFMHDERGIYFARAHKIHGSKIGSVMRTKIKIVAPLLQEDEEIWMSFRGEI
jgi:hypothetical protein